MHQHFASGADPQRGLPQSAGTFRCLQRRIDPQPQVAHQTRLGALLAGGPFAFAGPGGRSGIEQALRRDGQQCSVFSQQARVEGRQRGARRHLAHAGFVGKFGIAAKHPQAAAERDRQVQSASPGGLGRQRHWHGGKLGSAQFGKIQRPDQFAVDLELQAATRRRGPEPHQDAWPLRIGQQEACCLPLRQRLRPMPQRFARNWHAPQPIGIHALLQQFGVGDGSHPQLLRWCHLCRQWCQRREARASELQKP
jgi:hypothetical protein